ncbi:MAG: hypothetical protein IJR60_08435 [Eubacterium sp.]|nr:hypothetical protein [Eubacterium sp.]
MSRAKTNTISGGQLACLLVLTRLATDLLATSVSLYQYGCEIAVSAALSALVWWLDKCGVQAKSRVSFAIITALFFAIAVCDCAEYIRFTVNVAHPEIPAALIVGLIALFSLYAGALGCEAVARFSALAILLVACCILTAVLTNIPAARSDFFAYTKPQSINCISLLKCADIPLAFALFAPRTSGKKGRAIIIGNAAAYTATVGVILACKAVLGRTSYLYSSPIFALFQLAKAGLFTKLDILYICAVLILLFCELSLAVSAAKLLLKKGDLQ